MDSTFKSLDDELNRLRELTERILDDLIRLQDRVQEIQWQACPHSASGESIADYIDQR